MKWEGSQVAWDGGRVSVAWRRPEGAARATLVLGHGAGYNMNTPLFMDIGEALAAQGVAVVRFNFPYTEAGRKAPDPQPRLEACYRAIAEAVAAEAPRPFLGGKSLGGRIASHVAAAGFPTTGLVFLGYPLHPPGKPDRIRDAHLKSVNAPMLFLQGTRDPFASPDLLHATVESLDSAELVEIADGDHSFNVPGRARSEVTAELIRHIASFIDRHVR